MHAEGLAGWLGRLLLEQSLLKLRTLRCGLSAEDDVGAGLPRQEGYILSGGHRKLLQPQSLVSVVRQRLGCGLRLRLLWLLLLEEFRLDCSPLRRFRLYRCWCALDNHVLHDLALSLCLRADTRVQRGAAKTH